MNDIKRILLERGYVPTDLDDGTNAMVKNFPYGMAVWVTDSESGIKFAKSDKTAIITICDQDSPMAEVEEATADNFRLSILQAEEEAYQEGSSRVNESDLVNEAFDYAISAIQEKLGFNDTAAALASFEKAKTDRIKDLLAEFVQANLRTMDPANMPNTAPPI